MPIRHCLDCGRLTPNTRCPTHQRQRDNSTTRGYGTHHQQQRAILADTLPTPCYYCGHIIPPTARWVAAHIIDGNPTSPRVVAHPDCNERAKRR